MKVRTSRWPFSPSSAASTRLFPPGITRRSALSSAPLRIASPSTNLASTPSAWSISCIHLNAPTPRAPGPTYTAARTGAPLVIAAHASSDPPIGRGGRLSQSTQPLNASIAADAIPTNARRVRASAKSQPFALFSSFVLIFVLVMFRARVITPPMCKCGGSIHHPPSDCNAPTSHPTIFHVQRKRRFWEIEVLRAV